MSQIDATARGTQAIANAFQRRRERGGKALITYIMAGDPDLGTTEKIVKSLSGVDVDLIELGMPFSDPMADGPVIQRAGERALRQGVTLQKVLQSVEQIRLTVATPILIMTYYNLFYKYGLEAFANEAARVGLDGLIVPDLPPEEADEFRDILSAKGLSLTYFAAPTSTDRRLEQIAKKADGFLYYVSRTGVTGEQKDIASDLESNLARIRKIVNIPIAVGFGISNPEQAVSIAQNADGIVIGSAIVRLIEETREMHDRAVAKYVKPFVEALHKI